MVNDTGRVRGRLSQLISPQAHDDRRCRVSSLLVDSFFSGKAWTSCWGCLATFVRRHKTAARTKDSRTTEARSDRRKEDFEGSEPGNDGREMDDIDMVIEPAGRWRMSIIVGDVDGRATQRGRRLLVVVVNENTNQKSPILLPPFGKHRWHVFPNRCSSPHNWLSNFHNEPRG